MNRLWIIAAFLTVVIPTAFADSAPPNYHLVGWVNTFFPGSGQFILGHPALGVEQGVLELGTFSWGYSISKKTPMTLDGVPEAIPEFDRRKSRQQANITSPVFADWLQEFGIKYHFVNTFESYRDAARLSGVTQGIDQASSFELFMAPFKTENLNTAWVYGPLTVVAGFVIYDYVSTIHNGVTRQSVLTPLSNYMYGVNYLGVQPFGSGAPEEMFFRGFMQHEFQLAVPTPFFSIPATTAAFTFSHAPGNGRYTAAVAGTYLGILANRNDGKLSQGIAIHFWSAMMLGLETVLLTQKAERVVPPTAFQVQVNY